MRISVESNLKDLSRQVDYLEKKFIPQATVRALNRVGATAASQSRREIRKDFNMSLADFKRSEYIIEKKATKNREYYEIYFAKKSASLYQMGAVQSKTGVTVKAWGKKQRYQGAFIATMPNSKRDVFILIGGRRGAKRKVMTGKNVGKTYRPELPIKKLFGPYVPTAKRQHKLDEMVQRIVNERFPLEFGRAIKSLVGRGLR
jgi:hypothetical protein